MRGALILLFALLAGEAPALAADVLTYDTPGERVGAALVSMAMRRETVRRTTGYCGNTYPAMKAEQRGGVRRLDQSPGRLPHRRGLDPRSHHARYGERPAEGGAVAPILRRRPAAGGRPHRRRDAAAARRDAGRRGAAAYVRRSHRQCAIGRARSRQMGSENRRDPARDRRQEREGVRLSPPATGRYRRQPMRGATRRR